MNVTSTTSYRNPPAALSRLAAALAAVAFLMVVSGCGNRPQDPAAAAIEKIAAKSGVLDASIALDKAAIGGGDLPGDTNTLVHSIRTARSQGVSDQWLDKEIDSAESTIVDVCDRCYSMLESVR
jgi:hypothetical protein